MWTYNYTYSNYICHHGIKGQKWGVRRYQNENGSLTSAGKKRYSSFATKRYEKKVQKYTQKAEKQEAKSMAAGNYVPSKYRRKAEEAASRAKRSQEFDDRYIKERNAIPVGQQYVLQALVGPLNYDSYLRQRAAGIEEGKAMVDTLLKGVFAGAKARRDYVNQDVKKDRADSKAMERADKQFSKAAWAYQNARKSRSKSEREQYERSGDRYRQKGVSELNKQNLTYNDIYGKNKVINTNMAKSNFDYKKEKYSHFRRW